MNAKHTKGPWIVAWVEYAIRVGPRIAINMAIDDSGRFTRYGKAQIIKAIRKAT